MPLSEETRRLSGPDIEETWRRNRYIYLIVEAANTIDVGPTELFFPSSEVQLFTPSLGEVFVELVRDGVSGYARLGSVELTEQLVVLDYEGWSLRAVVLLPSAGCSMDVITGST